MAKKISDLEAKFDERQRERNGKTYNTGAALSCGQQHVGSTEKKGDKLIVLLRQSFKHVSEADPATSYNPGDIIIWKPALKNRNLPPVSDVMVVLEAYPEPAVDKAAAMSAANSFEKLDLRVGAMWHPPEQTQQSRGVEFIEFLISATRVRKLTEEEVDDLEGR